MFQRDAWRHHMLLVLSILGLLLEVCSTHAQGQSSPWTSNFGVEVGTDFASGQTGVSDLNATDNPLVTQDLERRYAFEAGFYAEFLHLHTRQQLKWGSTAPGFGIRTGINWEYYRADNSSSASNQSLGLNYADVPVLFEYVIGYRQGRTRASYTPGSTTYHGVSNSDGSVTVTETSSPGSYNPGGARTSTGTMLYIGPELGYLFESYNFSGNPIQDPNLRTTKLGLVMGIQFWLHTLNFDVCYQKGLSSIYPGKNLTVDGFMVKLGVNFERRLYNKDL